MGLPSGFIAVGDAQAKITLKRMQQKVRQAVLDREFVWWVREQVQKYRPDSVTDRDWVGVAYGIRDFLSAHIKFCKDPVGVENLTPPIEHMRIFKMNGDRPVLGDCDDAASLGAAMGMAVGIPAEFVIRAFWKPDNPYQHVLTYLRPRAGIAIDLDTTRDAQKLPPRPTREFRMGV